jgi:hypothetical protein
MSVLLEIQHCTGHSFLGTGMIAKECLRNSDIAVVSYQEFVIVTTAIRVLDSDLDRALELLRAAGFTARTAD